MYGVSSLTTYVNVHATGLRLFTHQNQMVFQVTEGQDNFPVVNRHTYECTYLYSLILIFVKNLAPSFIILEIYSFLPK